MQTHPTFLYGAATSAHQVEGGNVHNDWWEWEQATKGAHKSGKAADHKNKYKEDFALAKSLGHTAHRLSIEWSRIEPVEGEWNMKAVEHYRDVLRELRRLNMKTFVTLHHFTNPVWFAKQGNWENGKNVSYFLRYVRFISQQLGEFVDVWVTINEPLVYAALSYREGRWPPQQKSSMAALRVIWNMAKAHRKAYRIIHSQFPEASVGVAKHCISYTPEYLSQFDDRIVVTIFDWWFNHMFFLLTGPTHDYIGVNYYAPRKQRVHVFPPSVSIVEAKGIKTDLGWPIDASGLTQVLVHMKRYGRPVYILENGLADADDSRRADFIRDHLRAVEAAQAKGIDVRGYFHWSLLDNFEWADGYGARFGLVAIDYDTMERTIRPSAKVYKAIIEQASD